MAVFSDRNHDDGRGNVDAYLDAFIAGGNKTPSISKPTLPGSVDPKVAPPEPCNDPTEPDLDQQHINQVVTNPVANGVQQRHNGFYPPNDGIQSFKDFAVARDEMQQLLKFSRHNRPLHKSNRLPRQVRLLRSAFFTISLIVLPLGLYKHYDSCTSTGTCLWSSRLLGSTPSFSPPQSPTVIEKETEPGIQNPFRVAVNTATKAVELGESAVTEDDWKKTTDKWLEAINLMQSVPESSPRYEIAQQKAQEYIGYLASVQKQALIFTRARTEPLQGDTGSSETLGQQACSSIR